MEILNSADIKLDDLVNQAKTVVIVISTAWCMPCQRMTPILEELSKELTDTKIIKIDVSENIPPFVTDMGIRSVPTTLVYKNGNQASVSIGAKSKEELIKLII